MTGVHWHIIANLGLKFRSHFTAHCGRRAAGGRRAARRAAGESSRAMLAVVLDSLVLLYVFMCVYVCNSIRASVSGLPHPFVALTIKSSFTSSKFHRVAHI